MTSERWHILNGELVPESRLLISARDLGLLRGYGVFDFLVTYQGGRPFHLQDHIQRLYRSASLIEMDIPWSEDQVRDWVFAALKANQDGGEKAIRLIVTGGPSADSIAPLAHPTFMVIIDPRTLCARECYEKGVGVTTARHVRYEPEAKSVSYIEGVRGINRARRKGSVEVLYYNDEQVFEGATSNVFAVMDGTVVTPRSNILPGVTRQVLFEILRGALPLEERDFTLAQLLKADEIFLTASNKEVMPVVRIDDRPVGDGMVGQITKTIMTQFRHYTGQGKWE